jgi:hypothetical protein
VPGEDLSGWTAWGSPKPLGSLGPDDLVMIGGMRTPAEVAEHLGYVQRIPGSPHGYQPTTHGQAEADQRNQQVAAQVAQRQAEQSAYEEQTALPQEAAQLLETVTAAVPADLQTIALEEITSEAGLSERTIAMAAHHLGTTPTHAMAKVSKLVDALSDQVGAVMVQEGVTDPDAFNAWLKSKGHDRSYKLAQQQHLFSGQLNGYRDLARAFLRENHYALQREYDGQDLPKGYNVRMVGRTAVITIPGYPEMTVEVARQLGLVHSVLRR